MHRFIVSLSPSTSVIVCVSLHESVMKKLSLTADGRRQVPDDVSGREARSFQFIFYLSSFVCGYLRGSAVKKFFNRRRTPTGAGRRVRPKSKKFSVHFLPYIFCLRSSA
jgi:hypothetical protein